MMIKIYQLVQGPIHTSDMEDSEYFGTDGWVVVGLVEQDNGSLAEEEVLFDTFNDAYELVKWFKAQIVPFEVHFDD